MPLLQPCCYHCSHLLPLQLQKIHCCFIYTAIAATTSFTTKALPPLSAGCHCRSSQPQPQRVDLQASAALISAAIPLRLQSWRRGAWWPSSWDSSITGPCSTRWGTSSFGRSSCYRCKFDAMGKRQRSKVVVDAHHMTSPSTLVRAFFNQASEALKSRMNRLDSRATRMAVEVFPSRTIFRAQVKRLNKLLWVKVC